MTGWGVILAGGVGSRFWPLSTPERPKQLLPLAGDAPLLADAVARLTPLIAPERLLVLTSRALAPAVAALLPALPRENILAEPRAAGTGPALAWAAAEVARRDAPEAVMTSVHADWAIADAARFRETLAMAARVAVDCTALVTVGIIPERPDPGLGYIRPGAPGPGGARRVAEFIEKPDRSTAARLAAEGALWNSGIFAWRATDLLRETAAVAPEIAPALPHLAHGDIGRFFAEVTPCAIDRAVLERSAAVYVLPGDFGWDDVGTWPALRRVRPRDAAGNAVAGAAVLREAHDNVVFAEGGTAVLYGVSDLVVVVRNGLVLVTTAERATQLKELVDSLPAALRDRPA